MRYHIKLIAAVLIIAFAACSNNKEEKKPDSPSTAENAGHEVVVQEVIHVSQYTYLRVTEGDKEYWMAVPRADIKEGTVCTYQSGMEMKDFESKELKRKFETILFVDELDSKLGQGAMNKPQKPVLTQENISVQKAEGGITIAELYSNLNSYANKTVKIQGKVVKLNTGIMDKNWIHLQDGTKSGDNFDLTVTTNDMTNKDDIITVTGKIVLNKDFGYGYSYKVLMEEAKIAGGAKSDPHKRLSM